MKEYNKQLVEEYAKEKDPEYGSCSTCKCYGKAYICSSCNDGSEYVFDVSGYIEEHCEELEKESDTFPALCSADILDHLKTRKVCDMANMSYEEFVCMLKEALSKTLHGYEFAEQSIEKLQKQSYKALAVKESGSNIAMTINVDDLYKQFNSGIKMDEIISSITDIVQNTERPTNIEVLTDYKCMRDKLLLQIVPAEGNEEMLAKVPHRVIDDMAVVYRYLLANDDKREASILLTKENLKAFGVTESQLEKDAEEICEKNHPLSIINMESLLFGIPEEEANKHGAWVISNDIGRYGAAVIAYPNALEKIAEKLGSGFYLIPSSIHEMLAIPDGTEIASNDLDKMVVDVNNTEVQPKDRLTNHSYHYDMEARLFERSAVYESRKS